MADEVRTTLTVTVMTVDQMRERSRVVGSGQRLEPMYAFATRELMWKVLTRRREDILRALAGNGPMSIRAAARLVGRDVKAVHGDVQALLKARMILKTEDGMVEFPYRAVRVEYDMIEAA